jgi:hypothetical protein
MISKGRRIARNKRLLQEKPGMTRSREYGRPGLVIQPSEGATRQIKSIGNTILEVNYEFLFLSQPFK